MSKKDTEKSIIAALIAKGSLDPNADPQAQAGVGNVDYQQLQKQTGDKIHPEDAIAQIAQKLKPGPAGSGYYTSTQPADDPIGKLFGLNVTNKIPSTNYFDTLMKVGASDLLPGNLPRTPEGTPFVSQDVFKTLAASRQLPSGNNPQLTKDEALALKILEPAQAEALYKKPDQKIGLNELRLGVLADMASTRKGMLGLGRNKFEQQQIDNLINSISDAKQSNASPLGQQANKLNNVIHARQLLSQSFNSTTGEYDISKAAAQEVIMGVARAISPSGQLSDQTQEELSSPTAYGRMKGLMQYVTGAPVNANPQEITKMYRDMLDRQGAITQDLFNAAAARELPKGMLLQKSNPLAYAAVIQNSFGTHDYRAMVANSEDGGVSNMPQPIQLGGRGTPPPAAKATGVWKVVR